MEFYATTDADSVGPRLWPHIPPSAYLLSAASWWRRYGRLKVTPLPPQMRPLGGDCGGYVITRVRKLTCWPFGDDELAEWYSGMGMAWGATRDHCCEPDISIAIHERQEMTTENAAAAWRNHRDAPFAWVPTVQGWEPDDYARHARQLRPLVEEMRRHYGDGSAFRVGVGTLCKRADPLMARRVVAAVARELPGVPLHLWGLTHRVFDSQAALAPQVASLDSAAWNGFFGKGHELWRASGMTKRAYSYAVALPQYRARYEARAARPRNYELDIVTPAAPSGTPTTPHSTTVSAPRLSSAPRGASAPVAQHTYLEDDDLCAA